MSKKEPEKEKVYSIRGLDRELYEKFAAKARELNMTVGELMNMAMRMTLALIETDKLAGIKTTETLGTLGSSLLRAPIEAARAAMEKALDYDVITGVTELEVERSDLEKAPKPIVFVGMKRLVFGDDVTWELLDKKVKGIRLVREVVVPPHIPRLQLAKKCMMVDSIVTKKGEKEAS